MPSGLIVPGAYSVAASSGAGTVVGRKPSRLAMDQAGITAGLLGPRPPRPSNSGAHGAAGHVTGMLLGGPGGGGGGRGGGLAAGAAPAWVPGAGTGGLPASMMPMPPLRRVAVAGGEGGRVSRAGSLAQPGGPPLPLSRLNSSVRPPPPPPPQQPPQQPPLQGGGATTGASQRMRRTC